MLCERPASGAARLDIKYRDCVTGRRGPNPTACFCFAHNSDYVKELRQWVAGVIPRIPLCRVGRQQWVRGAGLRPPGRLLTQDFLRAVRDVVLVGDVGVMREVVLQ